MTETKKAKPLITEFAGTALFTVLLSSIGFALLHFGLVGYGITFFVLTPLCIGFIIRQEPTFRISSFFSVLIGLVAFLYLLISAQLEGIFCVITVLPLIISLVFIGLWIGSEISKKRGVKNRVQLSILPLLIIGAAGTIEHYFTEKYDYGKVETQLYLPYDPNTVYDHIKTVDTLGTKRPFLLKLGLPVPQKCVLEKEEAGAQRTCYFENGTIEEVVTEIKRGEIIKMQVTNYNLPGRKWLKFEDAIYQFEKKGEGTIITRITSYLTELKPRFYWSVWERKSIEAEHEYVLADLQRRLEAAK